MSDTAETASIRSDVSSLAAAPKAPRAEWFAKLPTALTTTVLAGIVTVAGTVIGTFLQSRKSLRLEREKEQHELVLKMISVGDLKQAKANLQFLAESGLIADQQLAAKILEADAKSNPVLPKPSRVELTTGTPCGVSSTTGLALGVIDERGNCVSH